MVTRFKSNDLPQPWHSSKKNSATIPGQKSISLEVPAVKGSNMDSVLRESKR